MTYDRHADLQRRTRVSGGAWLATAATIFAAIVAAGLFTGLGPSEPARVDTIDSPEPSPIITTGPAEAQPPESDTTEPGTSCWMQDDGVNRFVVVAQANTGGAVRAISWTDNMIQTGVGRFLEGAEGPAAMTMTDASRDPRFELWSLTLGEIFVLPGVVAQSVDCAEVPETAMTTGRLLDLEFPTPPAPVLAPDSTSCWTRPAPSEVALGDVYEITVGPDGGTVEVRSFAFADGDLELAREESGAFVLDNAMAIDQIDVFVIAGEPAEFTCVTDLSWYRSGGGGGLFTPTPCLTANRSSWARSSVRVRRPVSSVPTRRPARASSWHAIPTRSVRGPSFMDRACCSMGCAGSRGRRLRCGHGPMRVRR